MTFAKNRAHLSRLILILVVSFFAQPLTTQAQIEDLVEDGNENDVDGLFDEGLEAVEEDEIEREPEEAVSDELIDDEVISPVRRPGRINSRSRSRTRRRPSSRVSRPGVSTPNTTLNFAENIPNPNEKLRMDFVQVEIEEVVKFFAERLRKQFIYDPAILKGKITIISPTQVTVEEAYRAFLSAMQIRGYVVYPSGKYLKIAEDSQGKKLPVPLFVNSTPDDEGFVTRIVTLKYLNVSDIRNAVRDLVTPKSGDVTEHTPTNTLIITDYASNIRRIIRILNLLDVEGFQEQLTVVPLLYASAADVARKITEIFPSVTQAQSNTRSRRRSRRSRRNATTTSSSAQQSVIQKVVADERTNALIILGSERGIEQVKKFIEQIDVPLEGGDGQIHVYPLQNVSAEDISATLAALTAETRQTAAATTPRTRRRSTTRNNTNTTPAATTSAATLFNGEVKITADTTTNSLVIQSSPRDFETLKSIIKQLDIRRRQVFIESVILEASVGNGSEFGTQASGPAFRTSKLGARDSNDADESSPDSAGVFGFGTLGQENLASSLGGLLGTTALTGLALGFQSGGTVGVPITNASGDTEVTQVPLLSAIVRLAAVNSNLNVLSTPHILATANEEAKISIGEEIPQTTAVTTTDGGTQTNSIERIRIATELTITPQINAGDYLTLTIDQKVNEPGERRGLAAGQIATVTREATTTAIVKDGQTIVIGGIMRDRKTVTQTKVPFLGDIPILGWLFKSRGSQVDKVNLLLFITPHIIRDVGDMNDVFFRKIKERERFLDGVGLEEKRNVPVSGLRPDQLDMLDEEYVKSLELYPLRQLPTPAPQPQQGLDPTVGTESLPLLEESDAPQMQEQFESSPPQNNRGVEPSPSQSELPLLEEQATQPVIKERQANFPLIPVMPRRVQSPFETESDDFPSDDFSDEPQLQEQDSQSIPISPEFSQPIFEGDDDLPELPELELDGDDLFEPSDPSNSEDFEGRLEEDSQYL